jgi:DNA replication protein DnaC
LISCPAPGCLAQSFKHWKETHEYLQIKGISSRIQTFKNFRDRNGVRDCLTAFKTLGHGETDKKFLLCYGGVGNGKTHLCQAITIALNQRGIDAYYYRVPDLLSTLKKAMNDNDLEDWMKRLRECQGLVMDDYGLESETMWSRAQIEDIVDARWQYKLITVLTTNKDMNDLPPRLASRFSDKNLSVFVLNTATDYRK